MRPAAAIIAPAPAVNVDAAAEHIIVALAGEREAEASAKRYQQQADAARETARLRRLEVGRWLLKVRPTWPASGPRAKGWGEFLARVKLDDSTAVRYMDAARTGTVHGGPSKPSSPQDSAHESGVSQTEDDEPFEVLGQEREQPPFRQLTKADLIQAIGRLSPEDRRDIIAAAGPPAQGSALALTPEPTANVHGGSGEKKRGSYCTPKKLAHAVGPFDVDPFSNPRSHVAAVDRCMLENGGDGLVVGEPGSYRVGAGGDVKIASAAARTWIQPDYRIVLKAIAHYGHTRFTALLRFAPDTRWFRAMWPRVAVVAVPMERIPFETPEGVELASADDGEDAGAPFPHVLYYTDPRDITDEIARTCILLNRYEALRLVR